MSGLEVVGLVLGAVPLLISGMEHYGEGVRMIRKMKNASDEFSKYRMILEANRTMFEQSLEFLLQGDVDDHVLPEILSDRDHPYWSEPGLKAGLEQRLGSSYRIFFECVRAMDETIRELTACLLIDNNGKGPFDVKSKRSVMFGLAKIRFGLKMKCYEELVDRVASNNKLISQITVQSIALAPIRTSRSRIPDFEGGRRYAARLFDILQKRLASPCTLLHTASLWMTPMSVSNPEKQVSPNPKRLRILFHHQPGVQPQTTLPWTISEAEVEPLDADASSDEEEQRWTLKPSGPSKIVRFLPPSRAIRTAPHSLQEIRDLCASLGFQTLPHSACKTSRPSPSSLCLGYLSHGPNARTHAVYRPSDPAVHTATAPTLTLAQVLNRQTEHRLGLADRKLLALALASGVLRLHNTPWLEEQWGKHEVLLFPRGGKGGRMSGLEAAHPLISAEISSVSRSASNLHPLAASTSHSSTGKAGEGRVRREQDKREKYFHPCRLIKERTIFALAILLIELALEKNFDECIDARDLNDDGSKHELTDYYTAERLVEEVYMCAGERYGNVVKRCVRCEFDNRTSNLMDREFRRRFYDGVVVKLRKDVDNLFEDL